MGGFRHSQTACGRQQLFDDRQDLGGDRLLRLHGVDHVAALRFAGGDIEKGLAPFLVRFEPLFFEAIGTVGGSALLRPLQPDLGGDVEDHGTIRHDAVDGNALQCLDEIGLEIAGNTW